MSTIIRAKTGDSQETGENHVPSCVRVHRPLRSFHRCARPVTAPESDITVRENASDAPDQVNGSERTLSRIPMPVSG